MTYRLNKCNQWTIWANISITNFPVIFGVTSYRCTNVAGRISVLRRIRQLCRTSTLILFNEKTIQPVFDDACSVWCHTKQSNISKLQRAQNYTATIVTGNFNYVNFRSADLSYELNWASDKESCDYFTSVMMFGARNGLTPPYLTDSIVGGN